MQENNRLSSPTSARCGGMQSKQFQACNDRFFEEFDYERRLKKRKSKLISATEEAFAHLGRVSEERVKGTFALLFSKLWNVPGTKNLFDVLTF